MAREKAFYVVSALRYDSSPFDKLKRHSSEKAACEHATNVINRRQSEGNQYMEFYVLKVVAKVGHTSPPIKVQRLK